MAKWHYIWRDDRYYINKRYRGIRANTFLNFFCNRVNNLTYTNRRNRSTVQIFYSQ